MNSLQERALEDLFDMPEEDAAEVIAHWLAITGRNPDLIVRQAEQIEMDRAERIEDANARN